MITLEVLSWLAADIPDWQKRGTAYYGKPSLQLRLDIAATGYSWRT